MIAGSVSKASNVCCRWDHRGDSIDANRLPWHELLRGEENSELMQRFLLAFVQYFKRLDQKSFLLPINEIWYFVHLSSGVSRTQLSFKPFSFPFERVPCFDHPMGLEEDSSFGVERLEHVPFALSEKNTSFSAHLRSTNATVDLTAPVSTQKASHGRLNTTKVFDFEQDPVWTDPMFAPGTGTPGGTGHMAARMCAGGSCV